MYTFIAFTSALGFALVLGTFVEYWGHRAMHAGWFLRKRHARHHARNAGQGVLGEFRDYLLPTLPLVALAFLLPHPFAFGFAAGDVLYAGIAAYSHQVQHERPELCFWMARPVHRMHHDHHMWRHNFGIAVDWWDRLFGTLRPEDEPIAKVSRPWSDWFAIHWASPSAPVKPAAHRRVASITASGSSRL